MVYLILFGLAVGIRFFVSQPLFAVASSVLCRVLRLCWVTAAVPVYGVQSGDVAVYGVQSGGVAAGQRFETDRTLCNKLQLILQLLCWKVNSAYCCNNTAVLYDYVFNP